MKSLGTSWGSKWEDSLLPAEREAQILIRNGLSKPVNLVEDAAIGDAGPCEVILGRYRLPRQKSTKRP